MAQALARYDPTAGEAGFQRAVIELAEFTGWRCYHVLNTKAGRLASATGLGFPDLVLAKDGRLTIAELKADRGVVSGEQREWLRILETGPADTRLWTPADWPAIESCLVQPTPTRE